MRCLSTLPLRISKGNNYYNDFWAFFQDLIFLLEKPIAAVILCLFMITMSTETGISSLFYLQLFQWHVWKQLASVNFLFVEIAKNFGIATERKLTFDSRTFFTSKFDPNWDLNFKTVLFDNKFNALLLWKPSWLEINCKNQHLTPFFTGPNVVERDFLFTLFNVGWN